ncbi:MAG: alpha/beta hydrolase [Candidatus Latescibacteria bacterium]|nr:alpha/beta hydrolase [Candidatus Latescibacterota bacterium]MBT4136981.1 alpha/beta hydrolase [Candidatus Latescibacterota bacterium]MBT5833132.1 alpha/beta hydrolase [Candidatus Latescibacterota bacterium]
MKKTIRIDATEPKLWLDTDITFSHVPVWFNSNTRGLKLSLLQPREKEERTYPCIVWLCGGAWLEMNRNAFLANFSSLAKQGFIIAGIEYRTSNVAKFPAQLEDVKTAIRFLRANAENFGIDPSLIGIMGESAGGHLACLSGTTSGNGSFDKGENLTESSDVQAVCAWYPAVDLEFETEEDVLESFGGIRPQDQLLGKRTAGKPEMARPANPKHYISKDCPPFLLIHGTDDNLVPPNHSEGLYNELVAIGSSADLVLIEGAAHATIEFFQPEVLEMITEFFQEHLV